MLVNAVFRCRILDVLDNGWSIRNGIFLGPGAEREPKSVKVRVRANARILEEIPSTTHVIARFQNCVGCASRKLRLNSVGGIDTGDASPDNDDIVVGWLCGHCCGCCRVEVRCGVMSIKPGRICSVRGGILLQRQSCREKRSWRVSGRGLNVAALRSRGSTILYKSTGATGTATDTGGMCLGFVTRNIYGGAPLDANVFHRPKNDAPPEPALEAKLLLCGAQILGQHRGIFSFRTSVRRLHTTHLAASQAGAYVRMPLASKGLVGSILT